MEMLNHVQCETVAGASGAYDPSYAGASARQSQSGGSHGSSSNKSHDIYAGTDACVIGIGLGALNGIKGGPLGALTGVLSGGYGVCIGSSNNGGNASNSGAGNCSSGIGGVCN